MPRFYCPAPLQTGLALSLPPGAARHVQVLRMQPGDVITLFNGEGGEFEATVTRMGRSDVDVEVGVHHPVEREAPCQVHFLAGITANERMDWLVEKATELGAISITPVMAERSVLKLKGERADKKLAHWQGVAVAAAEQCGRNRVTRIDNACTLAQWLAQHPASAGSRVRLVVLVRRHPTFGRSRARPDERDLAQRPGRWAQPRRRGLGLECGLCACDFGSSSPSGRNRAFGRAGRLGFALNHAHRVRDLRA